jgi:hypothetical protein
MHSDDPPLTAASTRTPEVAVLFYLAANSRIYITVGASTVVAQRTLCSPARVSAGRRL